MQLSNEAILDLKTTLQSLGMSFDMSNENLNQIGLFLLTSFAEGLKTKCSTLQSLQREPLGESAR